MAGTSMKEIKLRIRSVENTMQITRAMQLVASSKLRGARMRMEQSRTYLKEARRIVEELAGRCRGEDSPYLNAAGRRRRCCIVIAGDRGLAGSYNQNVFKAVEACGAEEKMCVLPIGRRCCEFYERTNYELVSREWDRAEGLSLPQCRAIAEAALRGFHQGDYQAVCLAYTELESVLVQRARIMELLPVVREKNNAHNQTIFEPDAGAILEGFVPDYLAGMIYAAVCDSVVSEQAARHVAMDAATKNAGEMLEQLSLRYNRARQGAITQEISEIVAGAEQ